MERATDSKEINKIDSRGFACVVLPELDYDAQLIAIRHLLRTHENVDKELEKEINALEESKKNCHGRIGEVFAFEREDKIHFSIYQSAAHSMSAVGMLAPLMESIFYQGFRGIHAKLFTGEQHPSGHIRWDQFDADKWDCHLVSGESGLKRDLVRGIIQLSEATGLKPFLPENLEVVLKVLFSYRNKMFHCGFEWPVIERTRFWNSIENEKWPASWIDKATSGGEPWIFYLSSEFIQNCIKTIEQVISSFGNFVIEKCINQTDIAPYYKGCV